MLFQARFHAGLLDGSIDRTYRRWGQPRVKPGGKYRFGSKGLLVVDSIERTTVGAISDRAARRAGFAGKAELIEFLDAHQARRSTARTNVYCVRFHLARGAEAAPEPAPTASPAELVARLERMDRLSRRGPWTRAVLALIAENPRVAASRLAPQLGRELRSFKVDVRKLKKLGLTESFEVGYRATPLGKLVLKRLG